MSSSLTLASHWQVDLYNYCETCHAYSLAECGHGLEVCYGEPSLLKVCAWLFPKFPPYLNDCKSVSNKGYALFPHCVLLNSRSLSISCLVFGNPFVIDISGSNTCKDKFIL